MKKLIVCLIIILFNLLIIACKEQKVKNTLQNENFKGKIRKIHEFVYRSGESFGSIANNSLIVKHIKQFDKSGNLISEISYWPDYRYYVRTKFNYNKKGQLIREEQFDTLGKLGNIEINNYNQKGFLIEKQVKDSNFNQTIGYKYKNDLNGKILEEYEYNKFGRLSYKNIYKYDEGLKLMRKRLDSNDILQHKYFYDFDTNNNLTVEVSIYKNVIMESYDKYEYQKFDLVGNWILLTKYHNYKRELIVKREIEYY